MFEIGLGGVPQIEVRVQAAAEAFYIKERLLQQHELRLHLHVETARGLEQAQQQASEGNILDRFGENWFAHRADRGLELLNAGVAPHPTSAHVRFGNGTVIAVEERQEIFRQIMLVALAQRAHDAEVHRAVLAVRRHENIAGVHVGMKETVAERLGEKYLDAMVCELAHVHAGALQRRDVADRNTGNAFHGHHVRAGEIPVDFRHIQQRGSLEVGAQAAGVGGLAHQIQFVMDGLVVFVYHLARTQAPHRRRITFGKTRERVEQSQIALNNLLDTGTQHLDRDLGAVLQHRVVHLRHGGGGDRLGVELPEQAS